MHCRAPSTWASRGPLRQRCSAASAVRGGHQRDAESFAHTMQDPTRAQEWLDIFEFTSGTPAPGVRAQIGMDRSSDRRGDYAQISVPSLVIGFADDKMAPPVFGREVVDAIPGARYVEIERCGHYGYLERPDEINRVIIDFLTAA
ncbi:alpha/beta fold hydrolase [Nocardia sp. CA-084685]|uniref:alpha/beta fold hydrolase n=1 Tax=Nocardia sp. CA-084685 TaxID=3239970 RepID=UPI003D967BFA